jgi:hypothetical protein
MFVAAGKQTISAPAGRCVVRGSLRAILALHREDGIDAA